MTDRHTLYGTSLSLYTGKARCYLLSNGVPYHEVTPTTEHFRRQVLPKARLATMPTIELASGEVIRDGTAIIDHFEERAGNPSSPTTSCQAIVSRLFDVIGSEGLLRPAMHYRWNFPDENLAFLTFHFETLVPPTHPATEVAAGNMDRMRAAAMAFGAVPDRLALVEELYERFLDLLDAHFAVSPYLLGDRPSIGDYGLMAPMYAHLGRDPKPLALMQERAVRVFRWVERMNRPEPDAGEFLPPDQRAIEPVFAPDDAIPETLEAVLRHVALDFVPETLAACEAVNSWIAAQEELPPGTAIQRGIGMASFEVGGTPMNAMAQPYRFYLLQRVHDEFEALPAGDRSRVEALFERCGLHPLLAARLDRRIGRQDNLEVWL